MREGLFSRRYRACLCAGLVLGALGLRVFVIRTPLGPVAQAAATGLAEIVTGGAFAQTTNETQAVEPPTEVDPTEALPVETDETQTAVEVFSAVRPQASSKTLRFLPGEADRIEIGGSCSYEVDKRALLTASLPFTVTKAPQVLIVHTHTTEAYTPAAAAPYAETGAYHTLDRTQNMLAVGDALEAALQSRGVGVLHNRTVHDSPDYNASYANAKKSIEAELAAHPSVVLVLDLHRDAADPPVREAAEPDGQACAKLMFVVGTDEGGLYHPFWQENLSVALKLQALLNRDAPSLCRPLNLRKERFNGQTSPGALIVEVGSTGNTLEEALRSMPYLADAVVELLAGGQ